MWPHPLEKGVITAVMGRKGEEREGEREGEEGERGGRGRRAVKGGREREGEEKRKTSTVPERGMSREG